ncbi:MAG: hypothetical protein ACRDJU_12365, partial [Actinomycetota bacterium]
MQAAATCAEEASPGVVATLTPDPGFPQVLDLSVGTNPGGAAAPPQGQPQHEPAATPPPSSSAGASGEEISSPAPM